MPIKRKKPKNVTFWRYAQWYQHLARRLYVNFVWADFSGRNMHVVSFKAWTQTETFWKKILKSNVFFITSLFNHDVVFWLCDIWQRNSEFRNISLFQKVSIKSNTQKNSRKMHILNMFINLIEKNAML